MTQKEKLIMLKGLLEKTGMPAAYRAFPEKKAPPLPYICYLVAYSANFAADGRVYESADHVQVELYTREKDTDAEGRVEDALSSFVFEKTETYIESERCYQILYEIEV